tara:strand:- start:119 stop:718 length:600 start_codon:yes stop_codon:yes gene_type:complete
MKRIISNEDRERVNRRNQLIVGIILILLMLFSTVGFAFSFGISGNAVEEIEYNGIEFSRDVNTGYWNFNIDNNDFFTVYNPEEVQDIKFVNHKTMQNYAGKPLYFIGEAGDGFAELYRAISNFALRIGGACLDEECEEDYPIKDCGIDNVIIIEEVIDNVEDNIEEGVTTQNNCVYIRSKPENLVKYADAYLFNLLGIK